MRTLWRCRTLACALSLGCGLLALSSSHPVRSQGDDDDAYRAANEKAEFYWSRLQYTSSYGGSSYGYGYGYGFAGWSRDYPKADRQFLMALKRLTRIQMRSIEQVVDLRSNDIFNYPWVYAVQVANWSFTDEEAQRLREYLLKGGFLMVDDFHGTQEWEVFVNSMQKVFPDKPIVDIPNEDQIFHIFWDLDDRVQVPGLQFVYTGRIYEKDGYTPEWKAIYDDKGRIMVAICHNMDLGDSVEHNDNPVYPEKYSAQGMRTYINYILYAMTH